MAEKFIKSLRKDTNYPAFRGIINFYAAIGYLLAILAFVAGLIINKDQSALIGLAVGAAIAMLTKIAHETASIMVDIADASVATAERQGIIIKTLSGARENQTLPQSTHFGNAANNSSSVEDAEMAAALRRISEFGPNAVTEFHNLRAKAGDVLSIAKISEAIVAKYSSPT